MEENSPQNGYSMSSIPDPDVSPPKPTFIDTESAVWDLRKENNELKLKIFYLEERWKKFHSDFAPENDLIQQNFNLKVENDDLLENIERKDNLIKNAEDTLIRLKKDYTKSELKVRELKAAKQTMLAQIKQLKERVTQKCAELEEQRERADKLNERFEEQNKIIQEQNEKLEQTIQRNLHLDQKLSDLLTRCKSDAHLNCNNEVQPLDNCNDDEQPVDNCDSQSQSLKSEETNEMNVNSVMVIKQLMKSNKQLTRQLEKLRKRCENDHSRLDAASDGVTSDTSENQDSIRDYTSELKAKDELIERLNSELKKRTHNLQGLVNMELWDKNREIEKLNKICDRRQRETAQLRKQLHILHYTEKCDLGKISPPPSIRNYDVEDFKENIACLSGDVKLLKQQLQNCSLENGSLMDKISELEKSERDLREQLHSKIGENTRLAVKIAELEKIEGKTRAAEQSLIDNLRYDLAKRREEFEIVEKSRVDAANACSLLRCRLDELATFLENFLSDVSVSFLLRFKKKEILKQVIDRSREISRSLGEVLRLPGSGNSNSAGLRNASCLSIPILPDYSEINLSFSGGDNDDDDAESVVPLSEYNCDSISGSEFSVCAVKSELRWREQSECVQTTSFANSDQDSEYRKPIRKSVFVLDSTNYHGQTMIGSGGVEKFDGEGSEYAESQITDYSVAGSQNTGYCASLGDSQNTDCSIAGSQNTNISRMITASSAAVSMEDNVATGPNYDSESEPWSEPDLNVSAQRIGLQDCGVKIQPPRVKPCQRIFSDSEDERKTVPDKKAFSSEEEKRLYSRIKHLEIINKSLLCELSTVYQEKTNSTSQEDLGDNEKCDSAKIMEKLVTQHALQFGKYKTYSDTIRQQLKDLMIHVRNSNKSEQDHCLPMRVQEIIELFHMSELCCAKLQKHLRNFNSRYELVTNVLEETQANFQRVIDDSMVTKSSYNKLVVEYQQLLQKLRETEQTCAGLKAALDLSEKSNKTLEAAVVKQTAKYTEIENAFENAKLEIANQEKIYESKISQLLDQIKSYRNEEENSAAEYHRILAKVEELITQNDLWKKGIMEWKEKFEKVREEKMELEAILKRGNTVEMNQLNNILQERFAHVAQLDKEYKSTVCDCEKKWRKRELLLRNQLDASTLTTSHVILEWTKLADEKLQLRRELSLRDTPKHLRNFNEEKKTLEGRIKELENDNGELHDRLKRLNLSGILSDNDFTSGEDLSRPNSPHIPLLRTVAPLPKVDSPSPTSPSTSKQMVEPWLRNSHFYGFNTMSSSVTNRQKDGSSISPDLGIDSDHGRLSSFDGHSDEFRKIYGSEKICCKKSEEENATLKRKIRNTEEELQKTLTKLRISNEKNRHMAKVVCDEIYQQTIPNLLKAKDNLQDGDRQIAK